MKKNKEPKVIVSFEPDESFNQDFADFVETVLSDEWKEEQEKYQIKFKENDRQSNIRKF